MASSATTADTENNSVSGDAMGDGTTEASTTTGTDSSDGGRVGFCDFACMDVADCGLGTDELDWACTDGFCEFIGAIMPCTDDNCPADFGGVCANVDGDNICTFPCFDGNDCDVLLLECTGVDDAGNSICGGASCGGVAEGEACEIAGFGQLGTCTDGVCSCTNDAECSAVGHACNN